jgi:hypothetical protein
MDRTGRTIWVLTYINCQSFHILSSTMGRDDHLQFESTFKINTGTNSQQTKYNLDIRKVMEDIQEHVH